MTVGAMISSPSSRGRGLKLCLLLRMSRYQTVALFTRAWIEIPYTSESFGGYRSPSSRGRGLKWYTLDYTVDYRMSPSSRGRGLKFCKHTYSCSRRRVALFTRAWIEILCFPSLCPFCWQSPSSRGRGLKLHRQSTVQNLRMVALFTRAWIEISVSALCFYRPLQRRPLHEGVD